MPIAIKLAFVLGDTLNHPKYNFSSTAPDVYEMLSNVLFESYQPAAISFPYNNDNTTETTPWDPDR